MNDLSDQYGMPEIEVPATLKKLSSLTINPTNRDSFLSVVQKSDILLEAEKTVELAKLLSPLLAAQYEKDAGVWEGFSLDKHTIAVLGQYKKFIQNEMEEKYKIFFPLFLTFHDIGKPTAIEMGNKALQHPFSILILKNLLPQLGNAHYLKLTEGLLKGDFLGGYIKGTYTLQAVAQNIKKCATIAELPTNKFYTLLKAYYLADASAYTKKAIPSFYGTDTAGLGWLFSFKGGKVDFSVEDIRQKIKALEEKT